MSATEKIYWLSHEPPFLEDMWNATRSHLFSSVCCSCCDRQLCHGPHPPTNCHVATQVDIMIKSNKMLQLPMQPMWSYSKLVGTVRTTLVQALDTRFDQFTIILDVYRPGKVAKQAWKASVHVILFNSHIPTIMFWTCSSSLSTTDMYVLVWRTQRVEGNGLYLPTNRQVLTVTSPWHADFGNVVGNCKLKPIEDSHFNDRWAMDGNMMSATTFSIISCFTKQMTLSMRGSRQKGANQGGSRQKGANQGGVMRSA